MQGEDDEDEELARQEQADEDEAMAEMGKGIKAPSRKDGADAERGIPALDEEQEYEWKWKVSFVHSQSQHPNRQTNPRNSLGRPVCMWFRVIGPSSLRGHATLFRRMIPRESS